MNGNNFMIWILRSPFHGLLSKGMRLIMVTGCKSGRKYATPVEYFREDEQLWVMTSRNRTWWRNLRGRYRAGREGSIVRKDQTNNISVELGKLSQINDGGKMNIVRHVCQAVAFGDRFCVSKYGRLPLQKLFSNAKQNIQPFPDRIARRHESLFYCGG